MNTARHIWEGWTVEDFIEALQNQLDMIMAGKSWRRPLKTRAELEAWCRDNQPYYKESIPEVVQFFVERYGIERRG